MSRQRFDEWVVGNQNWFLNTRCVTNSDKVNHYRELCNRIYSEFLQRIDERGEELEVALNGDGNGELTRADIERILVNTINSPRVFENHRLSAMEKYMEIKNIKNDDEDIEVNVLSFADMMEKSPSLRELYDRMQERKGLFLHGLKEKDKLPEERGI